MTNIQFIQYEIIYKAAYTLLEIKLEAGERIEAESGDISHHRLNGETLFIQNGSYIASSPELSFDTKWGGAKSFFSREGFF